MPELLQEKGLDIRHTAPSIPASFFNDNQFWKRTLDNNDYLGLYERGGIAWKAANKVSNDLFDMGFDSENQSMMDAIKFYNLNDINWFAYLSAYISGHCLIFIGYADSKELGEEVVGTPKIDYFYVIPRAWIQQDIFDNTSVSQDIYKIYTKSGDVFDLHKSRVIRYARNLNEISALHPAFNALFTCDNVLWSTGQTMWRVGQGFPVITVKDPQIINVGGEQVSEVQLLRNQGVLKDVTSETGFIADDRYGFKFVGADGVSLKPQEYWDICFTNACIALEVPRQLIEGAAAGAVTGSETNLKDYYSDLSSRQTREVQKLYVQQMELLGVDVDDDDFNWLPLFEESQAEKAESLAKDANTFTQLVQVGAISVEELRENLLRKYPDFILNESAPEPVVPEPTVVPEQVEEDQAFPKAKYRKQIRFKQPEPLFLKVEDEFFRRLKKKFKSTELIISGLIEGFNTDSVRHDAVQTNFNRISTRISQILKTEKDVYRDIVERFILTAYDVGVEKALNDLDFDPRLINFNKAEGAKKILGNNAIKVTQTLIDTIEKDIGLFLSDVSLNNIPFTNAGFKREIKSIFDRKQGQLRSQVITETNKAANQGLVFGFEESGVVTHKMWQSVVDDRTTSICEHLNGEIVELGQPFSTGDFNVPAHINCRSQVVPLTLTPVELQKFKQ